MNLEVKISLNKIAERLSLHKNEVYPGIVIGKYESSEVKPSIEVAAKIAVALNVSLDYPVGRSNLILEKVVVNRIQSIQKLSEEDKGHLLTLMDAFLLKCNIHSNLAV